MADTKRIAQTVADDLKFAETAGSELGYSKLYLPDDDRQHLVVTTYKDDGEVDKKYLMYFTFEEVPGV